MSLKISKYTVDVINSGLFSLDGGAMFGVVPKNFWSKLYHPGDELNRIPLAAKPILLRSNEKNILIDTGNGLKYSQKFIDIYNFEFEKADLSLGLSKFNLKREDITDVILTHLHFDHAGGSTILNNGELQPTFPNAKYYVQKDHYKWAQNPTDKDKASFIPDDYEPIISNGMMEFIDGPGILLDGIELILSDGHTKSMQLVKVFDNDNSILFMADLAPTQAHLPFAFSMGYDNFPLTTIQEKKMILPKAYEEKSILVFEHDAFLQAGKLSSNPKGFSISEKIMITDYE